MQRLIIAGPRQAVFEDVPTPVCPADGVLVRARLTAVSAGTELRVYRAEPVDAEGRFLHERVPFRLPAENGYSMVGEIVEVGPDVPGAAGLGLAGYGLVTRSSEQVGEAVRLIVVSGLMFLVGRWYFEAIFTTGEQPIDIATWWPLAVIAVGVLVAARALFFDRPGPSRDQAGGPMP